MDGAADGKPVAQNIVEKIDRLPEADGGEAGRSDSVADKYTVRNAGNCQPEGGKHCRNIEAAKRTVHEIPALLVLHLLLGQFRHFRSSFLWVFLIILPQML